MRGATFRSRTEQNAYSGGSRRGPMRTKNMLCKYSVSVLVRELMKNTKKAISRTFCSLKKRQGGFRRGPRPSPRGHLLSGPLAGLGGTWEKPLHPQRAPHHLGTEDATKPHTRVKRRRGMKQLSSSLSSRFTRLLHIYCESWLLISSFQTQCSSLLKIISAFQQNSNSKCLPGGAHFFLFFFSLKEWNWKFGTFLFIK